jgi:serine/threonine protein kinase
LGVENKGIELESIVLEYIQGENLDTLVARNQGLPESMIKIYTKQIFDGILHMHSRNILHRDIKSANIMIVGNYHVKIIDFGMAKRVTNAYTTQEDMNTSVVGTLAYMV